MGFLLWGSPLGAIIRLHLLGGDGVGGRLCCLGLRALHWSEGDPVAVPFWVLCVSCGSRSRCASASSPANWIFLLKVKYIGEKHYVRAEHYDNH